jgi:hypothetical protein
MKGLLFGFLVDKCEKDLKRLFNTPHIVCLIFAAAAA